MKFILGMLFGIFLIKASYTADFYLYYKHRRVCFQKLNTYDHDAMEKCISEEGPELKYLNILSYNLEYFYLEK